MSSSRTRRSRSPRPAVVRGVVVLAAGGPGAGTPLFVEVLPPLPGVPPQETGQNLYLSLVALQGCDTLGGMKTTTRTAPAATLYLRVSSKEQGRSGLGIEAQEAACRQSAADAGLRPLGLGLGRLARRAELHGCGLRHHCGAARWPGCALQLSRRWLRLRRDR